MTSKNLIDLFALFVTDQASAKNPSPLLVLESFSGIVHHKFMTVPPFIKFLLKTSKSFLWDLAPNNNNNNNNNSLFAPITVIHLFFFVYECYNNVTLLTIISSSKHTIIGIAKRFGDALVCNETLSQSVRYSISSI